MPFAHVSTIYTNNGSEREVSVCRETAAATESYLSQPSAHVLHPDGSHREHEPEDDQRDVVARRDLHVRTQPLYHKKVRTPGVEPTRSARHAARRSGGEQQQQHEAQRFSRRIAGLIVPRVRQLAEGGAAGRTSSRTWKGLACTSMFSIIVSDGCWPEIGMVTDGRREHAERRREFQES